MHKRAEHLTVLTDIFSPCGRWRGNILPFSCPDKNLLLLKLRASTSRKRIVPDLAPHISRVADIVNSDMVFGRRISRGLCL